MAQNGPTQGGAIAGQLMQLLGPVIASPKGQAMLGAIMSQIGGGGGGGGQDPRAMMAQQGLPPQRGGGGMPMSANQLAGDMGRGPSTDGELMDMAVADQGVRGSLPQKWGQGDMTGYSDDMVPMEDTRQTPGPTTEQELEMVQQMMGKAGGEDTEGDFPTNAEIQALQMGKISPQEFDAKWGKGAAKEMMEQETDDEPAEDDDEKDAY